MNLNYHQLSLSNPLIGRSFGQSVPQHTLQPLGTSTIGNLQRDQLITASVARAVEPVVIGDLRSLREEEQNSEAPITSRAFSVAMTLLEFAHRVIGDLPRTLLVPSGEGGITIEWFRDNRTVRVIIFPRPDQAAYIYERVGRESDIKAFSKSSVVQALRSVILTP